MKTSPSLLGFLSLVLLLSACIQFRPIGLYDGEAKAPVPKAPTAVNQVVSPVLFVDDTLNIWGILSDSCKTFQLTEEVKYSGKASLKLDWQREGCEWVGFGMGWDDYAGKDLEPLIPYAAFQMYVRTQKGRAFGLPLVFTLEDYSGVMAFCYTANKYFERTAIDQEWQKVLVPLKAFNDEGEGIDYTNIKQLQIEMQQSGSVYIDDIRLVMYEEPKTEPWLVEPSYPSPTALPQDLFTDAFINNHGWGIVSNECQTVELSDEAFAGTRSIHAVWDQSGPACSLPYFGVNWSHWEPVNMYKMNQNALLTFYLKAADPQALNFQVYLEDFNRNTGGVAWRTEWVTKKEGDWYAVQIPLTSLIVSELESEIRASNASDGSATSSFAGKLNARMIKSLSFKLEGKGEMWIDQIRWVAPTP